MITPTVARTALLAASSAGLALALGCSPGARSTNDVGEPGSLPTAPTNTQIVTSTSTSPVVPGTATVATSTSTASLPVPQGCTPEQYCRPPRTPVESSGTGPPPDPNAVDTTVYDRDGCVARDAVGHTCNGIRALDGPTVRNGECCYSVCRFPVPCGRPLVVDGEPRLAPSRSRGDWTAVAEVPARGGADDAQIGQAWLRDAAMEHASIASFASLSLSLLSLGAPARLVERAHRAALDEIAHAQLCYGLALDARPSGPGPLDLSDVVVTRSLAELAASTVRDGCVGETVAALAAARAFEGCRDAAARAVLARIAKDELAHAELGFSVVAWALASGGAGVRAAVEAAVAHGLASVRRFDAPDVPSPDAWRRAGRLDRAALDAVTAEACDEVLRPCFARLLAS